MKAIWSSDPHAGLRVVWQIDFRDGRHWGWGSIIVPQSNADAEANPVQRQLTHADEVMGRLGKSSAVGAVRATTGTTSPNPGRKRKAERNKAILVVAGIFVFLAAGGPQWFSKAVSKTATNTLTKGLGPTTTAAPPASGGAIGVQSATTTPSDLPESPKMGVSVICPVKGLGYTFVYIWPGFSWMGATRPTSYIITIQRNDDPPKLYQWNDAGDTGPPPLKGQPANTTVHAAVVAVMPGGVSYKPSMKVINSSPDPC